MAFQKQAYRRGQAMRGERDRRSNTDAALQFAACVRRRFLRLIELRQKLDRAIMELAAGFGQLDTARCPVEQPCAEPILKLTDATAHRRFGDAEAFRPRSKPAAGNDSNQRLQIFE